MTSAKILSSKRESMASDNSGELPEAMDTSLPTYFEPGMFKKETEAETPLPTVDEEPATSTKESTEVETAREEESTEHHSHKKHHSHHHSKVTHYYLIVVQALCCGCPTISFLWVDSFDGKLASLNAVIGMK